MADSEAAGPQPDNGGGGGALVRALRSERTPEGVARALGDVAAADVCGPCWEGALDAVLAALDAHPASLDVARAACRALQTLAVSRVIDALLRVLDGHGADADVAEHACSALGSAASSAESKALAASLGALPAVVAVLTSHASSAPVASEALACLWGLVASRDLRGPAAAAGAVPGVCAAMTSLHADADVQERACGVLWDVTCSDGAVGPAEAVAAAACAVRAMREHSGRAWLHEAACHALQNLTFDPAVRVPAAAAGALDAVVATLRAHSRVARIADAACGALWNMTFAEDNEGPAAAAGAVEEVVAAMAAHAGSARLQEAACGALRNMASSSGDVQARAVAAGAAEAVAAAMQRHADAPRVLAEGCSALQKLALAQDCKRRVGRCAPCVVAAMRAHAADAAVQETACVALWDICERCAPNAADVARAGGIEAVVDALCAHAGDARVVQCACGALWSAVACVQRVAPSLWRERSDALNRAVLHGALAAVSRAREAFPEGCEAQRIAAHCLASLERREDPRVEACRAAGLCSAQWAPGRPCMPGCGVPGGFYCSACCAVQRTARCRTCDGADSCEEYCVACVDRFHAGHELSEWSFAPARCAWEEEPEAALAQLAGDDLADFRSVLRSCMQQHNELYVARRILAGKKPLVFTAANVWQVSNPVLERRFEQCARALRTHGRSEEEAQFTYAFHGTARANVPGVCRWGVLPSGHPHNASPSSNHGGLAGDPYEGVYASRYLEHALQFSNWQPGDGGAPQPLDAGDRVLVVMLRVLPGRCRRLAARDVAAGMAPTRGYDSHASPQGLEWFLFDEAQACPSHVIEVEASEDACTAACDCCPPDGDGAGAGDCVCDCDSSDCPSAQ
eukprot:m51a1_g8854 hypothetical protein (861) ;mRNA; f:497336-500408